MYRQTGDALDDVVAAVRMAAALNERLGQLVRPKSYVAPEKLENVLGEIRQLYPEVWSQLDDARAALARRGIEVAAYDELRATHGRSGGVLHVETSDELFGRNKRAVIDVDGHVAATRAIAYLRGAVPVVDWDALDRRDAEELAAAGSLAPRGFVTLGFHTLIILVALAGVALTVLFAVKYYTSR